MQRLEWVLCVALLACGAAAAEEQPPIVLATLTPEGTCVPSQP